MKSALLSFVLMAGAGFVLAQGGVPLWTNRFDGPGADYANTIAVDDIGNIFVAGYSYYLYSSHSDYLTVAYSNGGQFLWSNRYHGPVYGDDSAAAAVVDKNGRVFVTGNAGTIAYSNSGVPLWTNQSAQAVAIALDDNGSILTTGNLYGGGSSDWITAKLSPDGKTLWTNLTGMLYTDFAQSIAVDGGGNIWVAGTWSWPSGSYDFTAVKYSSVGMPLLTNHFEAPWSDVLRGMAVADDGTIFLTGDSASSGLFAASVYDFLTVAFSSNGTPLWTNRYGSTNTGDFPTSIKLDDEGNVIITGKSVGGADGFDYTTIKYSSIGAPLWTNRFHRLGSINNSATALAVDRNGNVAVTGSSYCSDGYNDYATVVYSSAGGPIWTNIYSGPVAHDNDVAQAVAIDAGGNVFITGYSWGAAGPDFATLKYSSSLEPYLRIHNVENQAVLTWYNPGFSLQSAPFATGTFTNIAGARSPYTNLVTGPQQFFRLIAN